MGFWLRSSSCLDRANPVLSHAVSSGLMDLNMLKSLSDSLLASCSRLKPVLINFSWPYNCRMCFVVGWFLGLNLVHPVHWRFVPYYSIWSARFRIHSSVNSQKFTITLEHLPTSTLFHQLSLNRSLSSSRPHNSLYARFPSTLHISIKPVYPV